MHSHALESLAAAQGASTKQAWGKNKTQRENRNLKSGGVRMPV